MADRHDLSTRELGRRRSNALTAALLAAGVTGTIGVAGWTAWARSEGSTSLDGARSAAAGGVRTGSDDGTGTGRGDDDFGRGFDQGPGLDQGQGFTQGQGQQQGQSQGQQGQQGGGFPQLGGSSGPGQAGSAGS